MDGKQYAVAEYGSQQTHANNLATSKPTSLKYLPKRGGPFATPMRMYMIRKMKVARLVGFLYDFVDFHILPQHIFGHPFCNLKGWLGIIEEKTKLFGALLSQVEEWWPRRGGDGQLYIHM